MKLLSHGSISPFRRRHPTAEEIVEEVYRRVQEQQEQQEQQQQQPTTNPKPLPNCNNAVATRSPSSSTTSIPISMDKTKRYRESRSDSKVGERAISNSSNNDSRHKKRSITPFGRRRSSTKTEEASTFDVKQLVAEYTSHNPGRVISNSHSSTEQSTTTFVPVDDVMNDISNPKNRQETAKGNTSSWSSIRRKKSLESNDSTHSHRNLGQQQKSTQSTSVANSPKTTDPQKGIRIRSQKLKSEENVTALKRQARSMSPFFRRRNKAASELIADAKRNAIELARVKEQPSPSMLGDRSLSGIIDATVKQPLLSRTVTPPSSPPRRIRSLSPFSRRKTADELISDVYRKMEIDYSDSTTGTSNDEDGVEIVLAGITDPAVSPNHAFLRKRASLATPTALSVYCNGNPDQQLIDDDETRGGLQTIATVLYEAPPPNNNIKDDTGTKRLEKSIRGRKSILLSKKDKPEAMKASPKMLDTTADLNVSDTTNSTDLHLTASPQVSKRSRRGFMSKLKSSVVVDQTHKKDLHPVEAQTLAPKLRLDLIPPSSIAVGARSRVSELSVPNASKATTSIPLSSRVKTRSLGERSLAEIQTALEKVQKELSGATKTGQTIPRDLVMEKLLAVADTIEEPDDRDKFLRKLTRLGSTTLSRTSDDGGTTSDDSDSSDDEDTSTDNGDTSCDESSFARWTAKRVNNKEPSLGQWTRLLQALGLNGLWDEDLDIDIEDLDMSHESIEENDDQDQTDDETIDHIPTAAIPNAPMLSFTGFIGKIASMGSFRDDTNAEQTNIDDKAEHKRQAKASAGAQKRHSFNEQDRQAKALLEAKRLIAIKNKQDRQSKANQEAQRLFVINEQERETVANQEAQRLFAINEQEKETKATQEAQRQAQAIQEAQKIIAINEQKRRFEIKDEEQMLRELEEMDKKIQTERQLQRKSQASERLKTLAFSLQKENERLDRSKAEIHDTADDEIPEGVIEMYVQEISAGKKNADAEEQKMRRAIEEEIMKQSLVDTVLNRVQQEKLAQTKKECETSGAVSIGKISKRSTIDNFPSKPYKERTTDKYLETSSSRRINFASGAQAGKHNQVCKFNTRTSPGSTKSRATNSTRRNAVGSVVQPDQHEQVSINETGTTLESASLISQPQRTISTMTSRTGFTFATGPTQFHQPDLRTIDQPQAKNKTTKADQFKSMSVLSEDQATYNENESKISEMRSQITHPSATSKSRRSWGNKQPQRGPPVWNNSTYDTTFDSNYEDIDDSYDDALSVGSIESDQFDTICQSSTGTGAATDEASRNVYQFRIADEERSNVM